MKAAMSNISILIYSVEKDNPQCRDIIKRVRQMLLGEKVIHVMTIKALAQRCRRLPRDVDVALLLVKNRTELDALCKLSGLLEKSKTILILPQQDQSLLSKAWELMPIYIDFSNSDFSSVYAVLANIINKHKTGEPDLY